MHAYFDTLTYRTLVDDRWIEITLLRFACLYKVGLRALRYCFHMRVCQLKFSTYLQSLNLDGVQTFISETFAMDML